MNPEDKARKRAEEIIAFADRLLGRIEELSEEELGALYSEYAAESNAEKAVYNLAAIAAQQYRLGGQAVPPHVQAALNATKQAMDLGTANQSALKKIIDKITAPFTGPVQDVSYAYRDKKELSDKDRKILDDVSHEVQDDWGEEKP